jgi:hypothetical protein
MADDEKTLPADKASDGAVSDFLAKVAAAPKPASAGAATGRLLFALDATASRQPTWDRAARLQGEMFQATRTLGGLAVQLAFYRGFGEFKASPWLADADRLTRMMTSVTCLAGETQIAKVLRHALDETAKAKVNAVVFVGDACEEDVDRLGGLAGELGLKGVPVFVFHEGDDPVAGFAFSQIAKLSGGAAVRFDATSANALKDLLAAVAAFAAGGRAALEDHARRAGGEALKLTHAMKKD